MSDYSEVLRLMKEYAQEMESTLPVIAKGIVNSPEVRYMKEISKRVRDEMPALLEHLAKEIAPYADMARQFTLNVTPYLLQLAQISARLRVYALAGEAEYVAWEVFPESFLEEACTVQSKEALLELIRRWLNNRDFIDVNEVINSLATNEYLKDVPVFCQAAKAYERNDYDLASLGFTAMLDRLLSDYSGLITNTSISKRVKAISEKIANDGEEAMDDYDVKDYILITTYLKSIELFGADSRFNQVTPDLNRHWIMHGRMGRKMEQVDCVRLINMLQGTILLAKLQERIDTDQPLPMN